MNRTSDPALRKQLQRLLDWKDAHVDFDAAVKGLPRELRGRVPSGFPYSAWQLVEHLRLAQRDIYDFCVDPQYKEKRWPEDYWPAAAPSSDKAWDDCIAAFHRDSESLKDLAMDPAIDLFGRIPHGSGQTYLREILLVADHNAYHVGQLVLLRRALGAWGEKTPGS